MISDELILTGLLANPTIRAAANSLEVSEKTIYERLRDSEFRKRYADAKLELLQDSVDALQKDISIAIDTFRTVAQDDTAKESARISAAEGIIRNFCRLDEHANILRFYSLTILHFPEIILVYNHES